ncbi:MAG: superoxide dismutase [Candidatus Abawacabacteria bacterium]|nr:superoxide dismutase [Candidatus Abawacabacteria bacterium]
MYQSLPLPYNELNGISQNTLTIHHDKLYVGYVNKLNEIEEKLKTVDRAAANGTYSEFGELKRQESFARDAKILHEAYFAILGGDGQQSGAVVQQIEKDFGSFDLWLADFKACGLVARGWVILAWDMNDGRLHNYICDAHNQGGIWSSIPVIVLDTYEHAYMIDYGSDRKAYIETFMKQLNWSEANRVWEKVKGFSL